MPPIQISGVLLNQTNLHHPCLVNHHRLVNIHQCMEVLKLRLKLQLGVIHKLPSR